jgi:hypothetical protein
MCISCYQSILNNSLNLTCPICRMNLDVQKNQQENEQQNTISNTICYYYKCVCVILVCLIIIFLVIQIILDMITKL